MSVERSPTADQTGQEIEGLRKRIFECGRYDALNNFSGNLPGGWRRAHIENVDKELLEALGEERLREDLKFFGDIDDAICEAGLDFAVIIALNVAAAFSEEMLHDSPESYIRFKLGRTRYIFPVYEVLRRNGYSDRELCA